MIFGTTIDGIGKITTVLKGLSLQAVRTKLATAALNATLTLGVSLAVSVAVKEISKLINKEKEAAAEAERLEQERADRREQLVADVQSYTEENKAIDSLVNNYVSLVASTSDVASIKTELVSVQDELIAKYGSEAEGLDLVNGRLSDNIELLNRARIERDKDWVSEHRTELGEAKEYFDNYTKDLANYRVVVAHSGKAAKQEAEMHFEYLMKKIEEADLSQYIDAFQEDYGTDGAVVNYGFKLKDDLAVEEIQRVTKEFRELYAAQQDFDSLQGNFFTANGTGDLEYLDSLIEKIEQYKSALDYVKELNDTTWDYDAARADIGNEFDILIDKAQELSDKINSPESTNAAIYGYSMELQDVEKEIDNIVAKYPALADDAKLVFDNLRGGIKSTIGDAEALRQAFIEAYDDIHKDALGNVEKIEKAMQSMLKAEGLKFDDFKALAWDIDTEGILKDIKEIGGAYYLSGSELIKLKDALIEKQIQSIELGKEDAKNNLENARRDLSRLRGELKGLTGNSTYPFSEETTRKIKEVTERIQDLEGSIKAYNGEIKRSDQLIREYRSHMGDLATTAEMLQAQIDGLKKAQTELKDSISKLENDANDYLKAQEYVIDGIVDKREAEKDVLNEQLDALNEQLEVLEKQEDELNTIIDNYKTVSGIVSSAIDSQIEELEKNRQSIEDYYNEQIAKLREQNEERQDAIDLAEKLAALENAKNNKVRSYSSATGWTYQVNKDSLAQATNDLADYEADQKIKALEKERDSATKGYDDQIKEYEEYAKEWEKASKSIEEEENNLLAQQILGSEWRTKINEQDEAILKKYNTDFRTYNSQLNSLVGIEMRSLKKSIEAKNAEIKAKQEQIDSWKKYKTEVQKAANELKGIQDGYLKFINQVTIDENSDWTARENNLKNFKDTYKTYMNEIIAKNGELTSVTDRINGLSEALNKMGSIDLSGIDSLEAEIVAMEAYAESIKSIQERLSQSSTGYGIVNSAWDAQLVNANYANVQEQIKWLEGLLKNLRGYSTGGSVTQTGLAMLHGSQSSAEVVFNASQAKKLYEYIDQTPNLMSAALTQTLRLAKSNFNSTPTGGNVDITIDKMVVEANNPEDFSKQFRANIDRYIQTEFTKSQVYNK